MVFVHINSLKIRYFLEKSILARGDNENSILRRKNPEEKTPINFYDAVFTKSCMVCFEKVI